ncbi:MAG: non-lysosomal glucosylceramidase [Candidatus Heimdallarchaeaceae archaeon]
MVLYNIPDCAWSIDINSTPKKLKPESLTLKDLIHFIPIYRRIKRELNERIKRGEEVVNVFRITKGTGNKGVPIGGLGGGSIGRGWRGEFNAWSIRPGMPHTTTVFADQFSVWIQYKENGEVKTKTMVLSTVKPKSKQLCKWKWPEKKLNGTYYALFPFAWTSYKDIIPGVNLICKQISPFIPHNYKESSYPVGIFEWMIENHREEDIKIAIMFTFQNGMGRPNDGESGHRNALFIKEDAGIVGINLHHVFRQRKPVNQRTKEDEYFEDPLTFTIATKKSPDNTVTWNTRFLTTQSGEELWASFAQSGELSNFSSNNPSSNGEIIGAALASKIQISSQSQGHIVFSLAWDMPIVRFAQGGKYYRYYTRFFEKGVNIAETIACESLNNYIEWEKEIVLWQETIIKNPVYPDWLKCALLNELYYLIDGGSVWFLDPSNKQDIGHFLYLECYDYLMFNTYDVHFYASFALIQLFPKIELSIQRDFAKAILAEDTEERTYHGSNTVGIRKPIGSVPHDLGSPLENPLVKVNAYILWDISKWKDLNPKFVLQIYRDFYATQDIDFLHEVWPAVKSAMEYALNFDTDSDGLIENSGFPDQTYDLWSVNGVSAYTGSLWLASLTAICKMAEVLNEKEVLEKYSVILEKGKKRYNELLWNGKYYKYDSSASKQSDSIMADQLAGLWYCLSCKLSPIVSLDNAIKALQTVFQYNVLKFGNGTKGAVNGMYPNGKRDTTCMQSKEVWTGTSYAFAALMILVGLQDEAFVTAKGIYSMTYQKFNYQFQTPEAWDNKGKYRALSYMRPLAIWSIHWAMKHMLNDEESAKLKLKNV